MSLTKPSIQKPKKLYVRYATTKDEKAVFDFYTKNPHNYVEPREPDLWRERIKNGAVTIIEDEKGAIMASSISYPLLDKDDKGNDVHMWTEIGSTRVALGGVGLFKILLSAQVLRAALLEPPKDRFALEVINGNDHSKHVFKREGAVHFDPPASMTDASLGTLLPGGNNDVEWFQMGLETLPQLAKNILNAKKNPIVKNQKTGEVYELDFSKCALTKMFMPHIKKMAKANFGDPKVPDPQKKIGGILNRLSQ